MVRPVQVDHEPGDRQPRVRSLLANRGYRGYWGTGAEDMYTVDVAGWHLIALNSNTQIGPARINNEVA